VIFTALRGPLLLTLDALVDFFAMYGDIPRRFDADSHGLGAGMTSPALRMKLEAAEVAKARIEAKLGQVPAADRHIIDIVPTLVDRVHEIVGDFEARVYAAGGPAVARARTDLKHILGTVPVKGELEGHKRVPYALLNGSARLLLQAANGESALRGNSGSGGVLDRSLITKLSPRAWPRVLARAA
jgi:hypothetical protein